MFKLSNLLKIIRFGVYLALLTPLIYIPQTIFGAIFGKMIYFQIIVELALPFYLCLILFYKDLRPKITWLSKSILIFFGVLFLSSLLGVDWSKSFWGNDERMRGLFGLLHFLALYFYIITAFRAPGDKKKLLLFIIIVGIFVSAYGVVERINPNLSIDKVSFKSTTGHRVISTTGNSIFLAGYLIFVCFLSLYYYLQYKDWSKWIGLGGLFLSILVIFYTGTRGAFFGLIAGVFVFLFFMFFRTGKKQKIIIGSVAAAIAALILLTFVADIRILKNNKYWNFERLTTISLNDASARERFSLWHLALQAFKERPLLGWGAENFDYAFDKYYNPQFYRGGINETWSDRAHNWFLDWLVMGGAIGLISYLLIWAMILRGIFKSVIARSPRRGNLVINRIATPSEGLAMTSYSSNLALLSLAAAFSVHCLFAVDDPSTTLMLFFFFAFCHLTLNQNANCELQIANKKIAPLLFLCFFASMLLCVYFCNLRPLCAGIDFISFSRERIPAQKKILAEKFLSSASPYSDYFRFRFATASFMDAGAIDDKNYVDWALDRAVKEMEIVLLHHPGDYSYFHTLGNIYLRKGGLSNDAELLDKAIEIYKKALEISPKRQATIFQLSTAYLFRGQPSEAIKILKEAILSDEKVGQPHWRLGVALLADGQKQEAYKAFKDSIALGFFDTIDSEIQQAVALCVQFKDADCVVKIYEVWSERKPDNADIMAQLAAAYVMAGRYEDAKNAVMKAVKLDPSLEAEAKVFLRQIGY